MKDIQIPSSGKSSNEALKIEKNLVLVGANGAGKSRLGSKLEQINTPTKRISAQRYLQLNEVVQKQDFETASSQLKSSYKNQESIQPQNDYPQVLISLFAEESKRNEDVINTINSKGQITKAETPSSTKEKVIEMWNLIFPYRSLKLEKDKVRADDFSGTQMSDGEKVGLYLISQILLAEKDCIFIIDEPELHLHKALMVRLWNKLEEYRNDCTFIYITHDLDFAVSKPSSKIIWIQSYNNNFWEWKEIDPNEVVPENLFLEMLGSRKPILFIEGNKGSLDIQIYQAYYENFTVIPCGSCEKVIEAVKGLKTHEHLHDKKVFGLIDKDFRTEEQLAALKEAEVFSITLNEVENLFLVPEIVEMVCTYLSKADKKEEIIAEIKKIYGANKEKVVFAASKNQMHRHLGEKFGMVKSKEDYDNFQKAIFSELDSLATVNLPEHDAEITEILKAYPHKGLVNKIQGKIELSKNGYKNLVLSFLSSDKRKDLIEILKLYLPEIKS
jgi:ABC-type cobalamin/Fe3+-siderophores transport system ATPase subunit